MSSIKFIHFQYFSISVNFPVVAGGFALVVASSASGISIIPPLMGTAGLLGKFF